MHTTPLKKAAAALFLLSTLLVLSLLLWTFAPPAMAGPYGELIKIDESSMSAIYPAVWFSPERGKVAALTNMSDTPPSPEFTMWIEPRDPEIALGDDAGGFALLGQGDDAYNYPSISSSLKFEGRIASSQIKPGNVFVCRTEGKTYLMKVVSLDTEAQKLSFLWKAAEDSAASKKRSFPWKAVEDSAASKKRSFPWGALEDPTASKAGPYGELIKIDESSMSAIYPAVWFSPERGKVAALTNMSDTPPSPEFTMWIEPRDPEIALGDDAGGFALLGQGDDAYNYPSISSSLKFEGRIASSQIKPGNVFVCRTEGKTYLMKVVSLDTEAQKLSFLWKCQDC